MTKPRDYIQKKIISNYIKPYKIVYLELIIEDNVFYSKPQYFSKSFPFHFFSLTLNEIIFLELSQELF